MNRPYRVGELVLMNYNGWLRAFEVIAVHSEKQGDVESVEYTMQPAGFSDSPQWQRPARGS